MIKSEKRTDHPRPRPQDSNFLATGNISIDKMIASVSGIKKPLPFIKPANKK